MTSARERADRGDADPRLVAALQAREPEQIRDALAAARLLVAVVALPGAEHASEGEMALALLESADGSQALPAFTGLDALTSWNCTARPVPRPATEVIAYARGEHLPIVLDPGGPYAWTFLPESAAARPPIAYASPTWKPGRRTRKAGRHQLHRAYAVDTDRGSPAVAVICPDGTLDAVWARVLLQECPADTELLALPETAHAELHAIGTALS
jgi:hypothetical protein